MSTVTSNGLVELETSDHAEMYRKFPEVELINDDTIRQQTLDALVELTPDYFWDTPAATTYNHHNPFCCGDRGLWIHTKMVFTVYSRLVDSWTGMNFISNRQADLGRAAVLLHDIMKKGPNNKPEQKAALRDHDLVAAEAIRERTELDEEVAIAVAEHMGPWYDGPQPSTKLSLLVHNADMIAASKNITPGMYKPAEEIQKLYPSIPNAWL